MTTLYLTRMEIISDLPRTFQEQNDLSEMSDTDLAAAWMNYGTSAGTEDWDDVCVNRVYYNAEMKDANLLSMFRDFQDDDMSREAFDIWVGEHLTPIEYFADEYCLDDIIDEFGEREGKYLIVELDSEYTPEFPYIPRAVWDKIEAYDNLFADIQSGQQMTLAAALVQLKLLRGRAVPEVGYAEHRFVGYDGMIMREA